MFINTNNTINMNSATLKNYVENIGNTIIYEDITSNFNTNEKYNILFEYDMEKEGFYIYYMINSEKYYLIDSTIIINTTDTVDEVKNYTKIAKDEKKQHCSGTIISSEPAGSADNINVPKNACDANIDCGGFTWFEDKGYKLYDNCDTATDTDFSVFSHSFKKNTGKYDFISNDLDRRQLFRFYDLNDKDITKKLVIFDNQTNNPFYIGQTNNKFCNQSPIIHPNTKYNFSVSQKFTNKTFKDI